MEKDYFEGKYVICRCYSAGVHAGVFVSQDHGVVMLNDARRLWSWECKKGVALNAVAVYGLDPNCLIDTTLPTAIRLIDVIEVIECTRDAEKSIREYVSKENPK